MVIYMKIRIQVIESIENRLNNIYDDCKKEFDDQLENMKKTCGGNIVGFCGTANKYLKDILLLLLNKQKDIVWLTGIEYNIQLNHEELLRIEQYLNDRYDEFIDDYLKTKLEYIQKHGYTPPDNFEDEIKREIYDEINIVIVNLEIDIKAKQDKPEVIYQRKSYYISVVAFIVSVIAIIISILKK